MDTRVDVEEPCRICGSQEKTDDNGLTLKEKANNDDTWEHIHTIQRVMHLMVKELMDRMLTHDQSKLTRPEVTLFSKHNEDEVRRITFNSPAYQQKLRRLKPALDNHYYNNRHHPEHFERGINDMTLIDVLEMLCDWKASSMRNKEGDIYKSIDKCVERFNISPQLAQILVNTADFIEQDFVESRSFTQRK